MRQRIARVLAVIVLGSAALVRGRAVADPAFYSTLPATPGLPDVLALPDGSRIATAEAWRARRAALAERIQYYEYGHLPPAPDRVRVVAQEIRDRVGEPGIEEWITLEIDSVRRLRMRVVLYRSGTPGRRPVIVRVQGNFGRSRGIDAFLARGYIFVEYAREDLDPDRPGVIGPAQAAYPDHDWATLAVWAWGAMRVVDWLETRDDVDTARIAITGHSRGGKMALLAGALDERFALVAPNGSGAGGAGASRVLGPGAESIGMNDKLHWYRERIRWFAGREDRLPFDQHFLKALVAPRALLCLESVDDEYANPEGSLATSVAAGEVFDLLGAGDRIGWNYRTGPHDFSEDDALALLEFAEWQIFGRAPSRAGRFREDPCSLPAALTGGRRVEHAPGTSDEAEAVDAPGAVDITWRRVGGAGNPADEDWFGQGAFGAVAHDFDISAAAISNAEYAAFLDAVAGDDPHGLYHQGMGGPSGGIVRRGSPGSYRYLVRRGRATGPVRWVDFFDAARFANWLHNGMPSGAAGAAALDDGVYSLADDGAAVRRPGARYSLPSEDEWYKAEYWRADAARYAHLTRSPKGDMDLVQREPRAADAGWEWTDTRIGGLFRGVRTRSWFLGNNMQSAGRFFSNPEFELGKVGLRIVRHPAVTEREAPNVRVANIRGIAHNGEHNAFTDLAVFRGRYYLAFRSCPDGHGVHPSATIVILESDDDGATWTEVHRFGVARRDTRDPHFLVFRDTLFVYTGTWYCGDASPPSSEWELNLHLGYGAATGDGRAWSEPFILDGTFGHYVWRAEAHDGKAFLCGRRKTGFRVGPKGEGHEVESLLLESDDGYAWRRRATFQDVDGDETAFRFEFDGRITAVARRGRATAQLCIATPPYERWERADLGRYVGGPLLARWGGRWLVGGRKIEGPDGPKTFLAWLVRGELYEFAVLPSAGDNSYPGLIARSDSRALVSWYSTHETDEAGRAITAVYLADLEIVE